MDTETIEEKGLEHLEKIEHELIEIKQRTGGRWNSLRNGLYQGAGAVAGGVVAVVLISWLLSILGVIPGFGEVGKYLQDAIKEARMR